jgi:1-acyl-sn-glycerol-3-phosphate acyltransferase
MKAGNYLYLVAYICFFLDKIAFKTSKQVNRKRRHTYIIYLMLYAILKIIFKISLRIFFRKIEVRNQHLIPAQGPLLIAANHPNTFMDPIAQLLTSPVMKFILLTKAPFLSLPCAGGFWKR